MSNENVQHILLLIQSFKDPGSISIAKTTNCSNGKSLYKQKSCSENTLEHVHSAKKRNSMIKFRCKFLDIDVKFDMFTFKSLFIPRIHSMPSLLNNFFI